MQRFPDDLIGDVGAVEIAGIDVVDAAFDGFAQHGDSFIAIPWRAEDALAGKLHGAIAEALHHAIAELEASGIIDSRHEISSPIEGRKADRPVSLSGQLAIIRTGCPDYRTINGNSDYETGCA